MSRDALQLFDAAIREFGGGNVRRVMDFGCGAGGLVRGLEAAGYQAWGCDFPGVIDGSSQSLLRTIETSPSYRLPFESDSFDVVVSTSVLEHAQNKLECFQEMHRVLRPGGFALHLFPAKWFLLREPHIHVPLASWLWPRCPAWWFVVWALAGVRNSAQHGMSWREVVADNRHYCANGLSYWRTSAIEKAARSVFAQCEWPTRFYLDHSWGGFSRLVRRLPLHGVWNLFSREFRYAFLLLCKAA